MAGPTGDQCQERFLGHGNDPGWGACAGDRRWSGVHVDLAEGKQAGGDGQAPGPPAEVPALVTKVAATGGTTEGEALPLLPWSSGA